MLLIVWLVVVVVAGLTGKHNSGRRESMTRKRRGMTRQKMLSHIRVRYSLAHLHLIHHSCNHASHIRGREGSATEWYGSLSDVLAALLMRRGRGERARERGRGKGKGRGEGEKKEREEGERAFQIKEKNMLPKQRHQEP